MLFIEWRPEFSVGIPTIDAQHVKLVQLINKLYDGMMRGSGQNVLGGVLGELEQYAKTHFALEERLLNGFGYPEYRQHKAEHDKLTTQVDQYVNAYDAGKGQLSMEVLMFLKNWLENHILATDKQYSHFLIDHGVR
ncbi:MAG: bacteriohemerythrin [Ignavibacteriales bacterium]|nr:bacteriohemerythrin [Ignavibacteriales bacterium]